jgi:hypothetical protein
LPHVSPLEKKEEKKAKKDTGIARVAEDPFHGCLDAVGVVVDGLLAALNMEAHGSQLLHNVHVDGGRGGRGSGRRIGHQHFVRLRTSAAERGEVQLHRHVQKHVLEEREKKGQTAGQIYWTTCLPSLVGIQLGDM